VRVRALTAGTLFLLSSLSARAAIVANFDGAAGDGYPGSAGNGWGGGWVSKASSTSVTYGSGVSSVYGSMGAGGGNYLGNSYQFQSGSGYHLLSRQYVSNVAADVDLTKTHRVSFLFRLDSSTANWTDTLGRDGISFTDDTGGQSYFLAAPTWYFGVSSYDSAATPRLTFNVLDGNHNGSGTPIGTGIALTTGTVFKFTVTNHPDTRTWDVEITNGTNTFTRAGLGWRNNVSSVGGYLNIRGGTVLAPNERNLSIDSVSITQVVPEPTCVAALAPCLALAQRRRRRQ
jgi:hypothetical protein